ncbi:alkylated DNA repair dioxygenase AlkB [Ulvibacter sp. MAR_2010_11]|uniref:alpha-ketoglutarate-dependent dioxygenase AlkB family protein n=1 Tax=Ulvibacter sp. MAR_2010_11 TaxID=1250229 RepID=UPI000C2C53B5|nr:alpha-ketoglutarate-dependent dioxygenase AlkB [Ulvibacter sp. MAR_2010_11]PKA83685.1 alkylated DNA repair dioxygenase AlkB [Ulvibacter sp. MAR_2010_11]
MNLFASEKDSESIRLNLIDADVTYYPNFFSEEIASEFFEMLLSETKWQQDSIQLFGKIHKQPRLTALYGVEGKSYSYSGITMFPQPFTKTLLTLKNKVETVTSEKFTTVLLNLYRDGSDSNGWHSDDEAELGKHPVIVSLSFGEERFFHFRQKSNKKNSFKILLEHGSLLVMKGSTQENWQHQLPKSKKITKPRINLTFRSII